MFCWMGRLLQLQLVGSHEQALEQDGKHPSQTKALPKTATAAARKLRAGPQIGPRHKSGNTASPISSQRTGSSTCTSV